LQLVGQTWKPVTDASRPLSDTEEKVHPNREGGVGSNMGL